MVGDYLKDELAGYLNEELDWDLDHSVTIQAGDTNLTKGAMASWVEVGEGTEDEGLDGVYEIDGECVVRVHGRDWGESARRDLLEELKDALAATVAADDGLPVDARRIRFVQYVEDESVDLKVFDFREGSGEWEDDDGNWEARIPFTAICCELD